MINTRALLHPFKNIPFFAAFAMTLLLALISLVFAEQASAHGYIEFPQSRSYKCNLTTNVNCGAIQFAPHDLEGIKGFPAAGPADGQIAGAGRNLYNALNEQSATRWDKVTLNGGQNTFKWNIIISHAATDWKYYITKKNWDSNQPLKRSDLELFCTYTAGGARPSQKVSHTCDVPTDRSGYHVILGTWDVHDTNSAYYQVIDVNLINDGSGPQLPSIPGNITTIVQTLNSITLNWSASHASAGISYYEVFRNGALVGSPAQSTFVDTGLQAGTSYTYTIKAVDNSANKSTSSSPVTFTTNNGGGTIAPAWSAAQVYLGGNKVSYNGANYEAQWWTRGETPGTAVVWKKIS
ncbi:lytic polysaccharide monooxygenase [Paenibacillus sp. SC116]|uniref:lytic polysaccharide monooxygenase n=1 Tax=Paenibacillus sp. SC116 TaxID=2968986 RepID=UPI00215AADC9|nr:lytic polysaccharide monooxygenase [Paenibacillus sp. SC116]MCR8842741.1 lytic polysaccharide monooxygenase [Paenibacillus sp. SC116]